MFIGEKHMEVSWNRGYPQSSSILVGFSHYTTIHLGYPHLWKHPYGVSKVTIQDLPWPTARKVKHFSLAQPNPFELLVWKTRSRPTPPKNVLKPMVKIVYDKSFINNSKLSKYTSSTAQGGGGSFKNRKPIGEIGCCESGMAERSHWWIERRLISLTLSLTIYLATYLSSYVSIYLSIYLSLSLSFI